jgi:hypothetical protein
VGDEEIRREGNRMAASIDIPWHRYGLIAELAARLEGKSPRFSKTVLEKMVYLLQELHGVPVGYDFSFYTYGPFSSGLLSDLDYVESFGGVSVAYSGFGVYVIAPGPKNESLKRKANEFLSKADRVLTSVVEEFGQLSAKDLDLRATIIFVDRDVRKMDRVFTKDGIVQLIREIKPHFSEQAVRDALAELAGRGYLMPCN